MIRPWPFPTRTSLLREPCSASSRHWHAGPRASYGRRSRNRLRPTAKLTTGGWNSWGTANLQQVRAEVIQRLYTDEDVVNGTASSGSATTIVDIGAAGGGAGQGLAHLESGLLSNRSFVGAWAYVPSVAVPRWSRITQYAPDSGTLTVSPAFGGAVGAVAYEIHYLIHPERINELIKIRARVGSRTAMDSIAEATGINMDKNVLAEGVLADCKRVLAKRTMGAERQLLLEEAKDHEAKWQEGLVLHGYGESWAAPSIGSFQE